MLPHGQLKEWVAHFQQLCQPKKVHWCSGTEEEQKQFFDELEKTGKAVKLNQIKRPNSYAFFSDPSDVARTENRTFIASEQRINAGPSNNWIDPQQLKTTMNKLFKGCMKGRTMYVIPFIMGPSGSPISKVGIQITDSLYVVVNMNIMTRTGETALKQLKKTKQFIPCLHSVGYPLKKGQKDPIWPCAPIENKYIAHFPEERAIWSYGSGYGGNALLGKKCLALRIASVIARDEGWMAEHMLILKITNPQGKSKFILGAFPSSCGKTNLTMLVPTMPGWKVETVGDDIAWIWMKKDGRFYAINPENGFFGVLKNMSYKRNINAMMAIRKNTIFTNAALTDDFDVWWEGIDKEKPNHLLDWKLNHWTGDSVGSPSHPNARFTVAATQCPVLAEEWDDPKGVPISAILFGGRRPTTIPLVHESLSWNHGVFMGATLGSEITSATISDNIGKVRRDPFAMLPFIGYHIGDYFQHWISIGRKTKSELLPKIYCVNWFKKDENDEYLWPGYGHNSRVLKWIFNRCDNKAEAELTPIGNVPTLEALDVKGVPMKLGALEKLRYIDKEEWEKEISLIEEYFIQLDGKIPNELLDELDKLKRRFSK
jgi:phosphoenolpyruvate carboxykinase (GTP)